MLSDSVRLPAARFSVTGSTGRRRSLSLRPTSLAHRNSLLEAGSVPSLAPAAILAIHKGGKSQGGRTAADSLARNAVSRRSGRVHEGPRRARMPVNWAGSKCLGRTEKETELLRFHAPQAPGNSHCAPTR